MPSNRYKKRNPGAIPYDRKTAKDFMEGVVRGCCASKEGPSIYYMLQKWIDFSASWKRRPGNDKILLKCPSRSILFVLPLSLPPSLLPLCSLSALPHSLDAPPCSSTAFSMLFQCSFMLLRCSFQSGLAFFSRIIAVISNPKFGNYVFGTGKEIRPL